MKKRAILLSGLALAGYYLKDKERRDHLFEKINEMKNQFMNTNSSNHNKIPEEFPIEKGGHPYPQDFEDNKMVSEGSQYSVKYYNENEQ